MENSQQQANKLKNAILTDPARVRRLSIKEAEEMAAKEKRSRRLNVKSIEEKILFFNK